MPLADHTPALMTPTARAVEAFRRARDAELAHDPDGDWEDDPEARRLSAESTARLRDVLACEPASAADALLMVMAVIYDRPGAEAQSWSDPATWDFDAERADGLDKDIAVKACSAFLATLAPPAAARVAIAEHGGVVPA